MAPPPWELLVMVNPSMLEGLHWKLLGKGLAVVVTPPVVVVALQSGLASPVLYPPTAVTGPVSRVVPVANAPSAAPALAIPPDPLGNWTPFESTVIPAPSSAPISDGSCSNWARLPFCEASHPITASVGTGSTWALSPSNGVK